MESDSDIESSSKDNDSSYEKSEEDEEKQGKEKTDDFSGNPTMGSKNRYVDPIDKAIGEFTKQLKKHNLDESFIEDSIKSIKGMNNLTTLNSELLALAAVFHISYDKINKRNVTEFIDQNPSFYPVDIIRYIRLYGSKRY